MAVFEILFIFLGMCLWQLKNRSLGSLKIQSVYWGLGV